MTRRLCIDVMRRMMDEEAETRARAKQRETVKARRMTDALSVLFVSST